MTKEEFIQAHIAVCKRTGRKRWLRTAPKGKHHNNGAYRTHNEHHRRRECAKELWKTCLELGIEPVLHHADLPKLIESKKGKADPTS